MSNPNDAPGWTDALAQVLQPALSDRFLRDLQANPRHTRHPAGSIWRSALAESVFSDLSLGVHGVRRFVRMEYLGLSGIILYNLPAGRHPRGPLVEEKFQDEDGEDDTMLI